MNQDLQEKLDTRIELKKRHQILNQKRSEQIEKINILSEKVRNLKACNPTLSGTEQRRRRQKIELKKIEFHSLELNQDIQRLLQNRVEIGKLCETMTNRIGPRISEQTFLCLLDLMDREENRETTDEEKYEYFVELLKNEPEEVLKKPRLVSPILWNLEKLEKQLNEDVKSLRNFDNEIYKSTDPPIPNSNPFSEMVKFNRLKRRLVLENLDE